MNFNNNRLMNTARPAHRTAADNTADQSFDKGDVTPEDGEAFSKALEGKQTPEKQQYGKRESRQDSGETGQQMADQQAEPSDGKLPSAESLMAGLFGQMEARSGAGDATSVGVMPSQQVQEMDEMVGKLVDRILVSSPGSDSQEVRITFTDQAIKGTEVFISRDGNGMLFVRLSTTDAASFQTLVGAQHDLRNALGQQGGDVRVEVRQDSAESGAESGSGQDASEQRSKGFQEYQQSDD